MSSDWRSVWIDVDLRYQQSKEAQGAIIELFERYAELDPAGRGKSIKVTSVQLIQVDQ